MRQQQQIFLPTELTGAQMELLVVLLANYHGKTTAMAIQYLMLLQVLPQMVRLKVILTQMLLGRQPTQLLWAGTVLVHMVLG